MTTAQYITVRETAQILGISEKKVMDLVEEKKLQAYRIAGQFLRLKKTEVVDIKNAGAVTREHVQFTYNSFERINDFLYYNNFYIFSGLIILALLYIILYL
ncbi:MAG: helix-turn-helix domain-containing protein [Candidatus Omnitrophota bacterium]